jgi:hypothetical protein
MTVFFHLLSQPRRAPREGNAVEVDITVAPRLRGARISAAPLQHVHTFLPASPSLPHPLPPLPARGAVIR